IEYRVSEAGNIILVPSSDVHELRMSLAKEGLPEEGSIGYELFDRSNLGMTDFVQKLNYRRALEGELSKTIQQIKTVKSARVHIVLPEKALFSEDQKKTTASIILSIKGNFNIGVDNVQAIVHLVASSVEGLAPEHVTVIDTRGKVLSNNSGSSDLMALSSNQMQIRKKIEDYLSKKAQGMLNSIIGPGNSVVQISADLNFKQVEKTIEYYDPDNTVIRSEQISESQEQNTSGAASVTQTTSGGNASTSETVTNYDINKTIQHVVEEVGNIKKLSIGVIINNKPKVVEVDGEKQLKFEKRDDMEMKTLTDFVKNGVGFNLQRGDEISVQSLDFTSPMLEQEYLDELKPIPIWENVIGYFKYAIIIILIIATILLVRSIANTVSIKPDILPGPLKEIEESYIKSVEAKEEREALEALPIGKKSIKKLPAGDIEEDLSEEVLAKSQFRDKINKYAEEKPEEAVKLLRVWMYEGEEEGF
ncbi:MAG: flagellar M-ring protein FliF, partial [Calditrichia bacterium]|nr:flagellar M-ring protein FliF [Calditrichia bacterium]